MPSYPSGAWCMMKWSHIRIISCSCWWNKFWSPFKETEMKIYYIIYIMLEILITQWNHYKRHSTQWGFEMYPIAIHQRCWSNYDFIINFIMYIYSLNQYKMLLNKFIYCIFLRICNSTLWYHIFWNKGKCKFQCYC